MSAPSLEQHHEDERIICRFGARSMYGFAAIFGGLMVYDIMQRNWGEAISEGFATGFTALTGRQIGRVANYYDQELIALSREQPEQNGSDYPTEHYDRD